MKTICSSKLGSGTFISKESSGAVTQEKRRFTYDMKLAMQTKAFIFLLALGHMSEIRSSKRSLESIKTPSSAEFNRGTSKM